MKQPSFLKSPFTTGLKTACAVLALIACLTASGVQAAPTEGAVPPPAQTAPVAGKKPNILVIWGDDIGTWNISHNSRGMMGYQTPNIDRIAKEGVGFTDYYA
jgi:hypothetical protein